MRTGVNQQPRWVGSKICVNPYVQGRKVERHVPLLEGKALRDAWLNKHMGMHASGAAQQPLGDSSVRRISIAAGFPSSGTSADQGADPPLPSPTAATAAAVATSPDLAREQSVEEGELIPGQPAPASPPAAAAADAPQPGAGSAQPLLGTPDAPQSASMASAPLASGAAGQASTAMQVTADATVSASQSAAAEEAERGREQQQAQEGAALLQQQQARQAYALQRQLKEQKKQEQLQRLNKSLGIAFAQPAASQSAPALASLPPPQALFPAPLDAAAAAALQHIHQPPVQLSRVAPAVPSTSAPAVAGTVGLPPPVTAPVPSVSAAPAAAATQRATSAVSSAASLPVSTALQPPTAVAALSGAPVQASSAAPAPHEQRAATPPITSRSAASNARGQAANSISRTAEAFLDSLSWSQPQPPSAGAVLHLVGATPAEAPATSGLPTLVIAKDQADGKLQDVASPVAVSEASNAGGAQQKMSKASASTEAPESNGQGGEQKQTQDLSLQEALIIAPVMSAPAAAAVVEQAPSAQAAHLLPMTQPPVSAPGASKVADAAQSMEVETPSAGEGPEPLTAGSLGGAATHAQPVTLAHWLPEGASARMTDAPALAAAMPAQATPAVAVPQPTAAVNSGQVGVSSAAHGGSSRDISISFGGSSSRMSAEQTSEAVPAAQHASNAAGAQPRAASQQPHAVEKLVPKAGPVKPLRAPQQPEGLQGTSRPQPVPIKRPPASVPKPPTGLPVSTSPNKTASGQCAEAQPSLDLQGGSGAASTPTAAAIASAQVPSSSPGEGSGRPVDRIDAIEAAALHSASQSPQTPLYFRLTDVALGGDMPSQEEVTGRSVTGSWATRAPLSTTATVLRGTSAAARSGSSPASTKSGSAWSALPAQPRGAPGASPAGKQPLPRPQPRKESPGKPALAGPLANRKRPAEGIRGPERSVKRTTVIKTGCRSISHLSTSLSCILRPCFLNARPYVSFPELSGRAQCASVHVSM